jgi:drug/metabolite transporter (DMT)-like permease
MAISLTCFTVNALLLKHLALHREVGAWMSLLFRASIGLAVAGLFFQGTKAVNWRRALAAPLMISRGVLGAFGTAAYYLTIPALGAGKATLIGNTWVVWASLMAAAVLKEPLSKRKLLGIVVALGGLTLLTGIGGEAALKFGLNEFIAIAGAFVAAATVVVIRQLTRTDTSTTIYAAQCAYTALLALPFTLGHWSGLDGVDVLLLSLAAILASYGQIAMTEGFRHLSVSLGGAFQVLLPLTITLASVAVFSEAFTKIQIGGGLLILAGCFTAVTADAAAARKK